MSSINQPSNIDYTVTSTSLPESFVFSPDKSFSSNTMDDGENELAYSVISNMNVGKTLKFDIQYKPYIESIILKINSELNYEYETIDNDSHIIVKRLI